MAAELRAWFATHRRDLPWRAQTCSAWGVLVSEVMLQQTPVARVEPVWRAWLHRWPTPADLAAAPIADVIVAWGRLGYPRRALRLHDAAHTIVERHGGQVPRAAAELRALPGIGEYTAAAVRAFAFGEGDTVLDTNVRRVLARLAGGQALPAPSLTRAERERAAAWRPPAARERAPWYAALMELGALVCTAAKPACGHCPLASHCAWLKAGRPADQWASGRRTQAWQGTDRQVRGKIMALARSGGTLQASELDSLGAQESQLERCLASLVADHLLAAADGGYRLP